MKTSIPFSVWVLSSCPSVLGAGHGAVKRRSPPPRPDEGPVYAEVNKKGRGKQSEGLYEEAIPVRGAIAAHGYVEEPGYDHITAARTMAKGKGKGKPTVAAAEENLYSEAIPVPAPASPAPESDDESKLWEDMSTVASWRPGGGAAAAPRGAGAAPRRARRSRAEAAARRTLPGERSESESEDEAYLEDVEAVRKAGLKKMHEAGRSVVTGAALPLPLAPKPDKPATKPKHTDAKDVAPVVPERPAKAPEVPARGTPKVPERAKSPAAVAAGQRQPAPPPTRGAGPATPAKPGKGAGQVAGAPEGPQFGMKPSELVIGRSELKKPKG